MRIEYTNNMSFNTQLFRKPIEPYLLFDLLDKVCMKKQTHYVVDINAYKKMMYHNYHIAFCDILFDYYHISKHFYISRHMTFKSLTTIVRQICKSCNIAFNTSIRYNKSDYAIEYYIYTKLTE